MTVSVKVRRCKGCAACIQHSHSAGPAAEACAGSEGAQLCAPPHSHNLLLVGQQPSNNKGGFCIRTRGAGRTSCQFAARPAARPLPQPWLLPRVTHRRKATHDVAIVSGNMCALYCCMYRCNVSCTETTVGVYTCVHPSHIHPHPMHPMWPSSP